MKKIVVRALSGAVYVGLIVGSLLYGGGMMFPLLCTILALLAVIEFDRLASYGGKRAASVRTLDTILCVIPVLALAYTRLGLSQYVYTGTRFAAGLFMALLMVRVVYTLYSRESDPLRSLAFTLLAIGYIAMPLSMAALLSEPRNRFVLLLVFVMIWINDTGAFLTGITFGRHRLCERLSPKKSWEGFFGGLLFAAATGLGAYLLFPEIFGYLTPIGAVALGVVVSVFSTWGDLFESLVKRLAGAKDSGRIMPGHGGILDRIDSLLFVIPVVFVLYFLL